jgi:hypothetical protein
MHRSVCFRVLVVGVESCSAPRADLCEDFSKTGWRFPSQSELETRLEDIVCR